MTLVATMTDRRRQFRRADPLHQNVQGFVPDQIVHM